MTDQPSLSAAKGERYVGLCSCGRQYHAATVEGVEKKAAGGVASGHDVTVWRFIFGLAGRKDHDE